MIQLAIEGLFQNSLNSTKVKNNLQTADNQKAADNLVSNTNKLQIVYKLKESHSPQRVEEGNLAPLNIKEGPRRAETERTRIHRKASAQQLAAETLER